MLSLYFEVHYYLFAKFYLYLRVCAPFWPPNTIDCPTDKRFEQGGDIGVGGQREQGLGA